MSINIDLQNITKYPEFYALKQELLKFCDTMESISDIELNERNSRFTLEQELYGRLYASEKIRALLQTLGVLREFKPVKNKTFE